MSTYDDRPWLARYDAGQPSDIELEFTSALAMFSVTMQREPDAGVGGAVPAERAAVPRRDAGHLEGRRDHRRGQSNNKERELELILRDSEAAVLVCHDDLYRGVARQVVGGTDVQLVVTTSALDFQSRDDDRIFGGIKRLSCGGTQNMAELTGRFRGQPLPAVELGPDDVAFLTYTSGTTGPPKGAMTTHGNVVFNAQTYRDWIGIGPDDVILGVTPLFHITGSIRHVALSLLTGAAAGPDVPAGSRRGHRDDPR